MSTSNSKSKLLFWVFVGVWALSVLVGGFMGFMTTIIAAFSTHHAGGAIGAMILGGILGVPMMAIYILIPLIIDRYEPEPWWSQMMAFLWGACFCVGLALPIITFIDSLGGRHVNHALSFFTGVVFAPFLEESLKGFFLLMMLFLLRDELDGAVDGLIYGMLVALGFVTMENIIYYGKEAGAHGLQISQLFGTFVERFHSYWSHPLFTAMTGLGVGLSRESTKPILKFGAPVAGWMLAVMLHGAWNMAAWVAEAAHASWIGIFILPVWFVIVVIFVGVIVWLVSREVKIIRENLQEEVTNGLISEEEFKLICAPTGKIQVLIKNNGRKGGQFFDAASKLGIAKWHRTRGELQADSIGGDPIEKLRQEMVARRTEWKAALFFLDNSGAGS